MKNGGVKSFTDLDAWKKNHLLVLNIYRCTKNFPKEERFGLTNQIRRCAVSITSNISEGFGRWHKNEKIHFYSIALGSMNELQNQMLIAKDINYIDTNLFEKMSDLSIEGKKLINSLISSTKKKTNK